MASLNTFSEAVVQCTHTERKDGKLYDYYEETAASHTVPRRLNPWRM